MALSYDPKMVGIAAARNVHLTLRSLLETKHLYQSVEVETPPALVLLKKKANPDRTELVLMQAAEKVWDGEWYVIDPSGGSYTFGENSCNFHVPDIKIFCTICDRVEPFAPVAASDYFAPRPPVKRLVDYKLTGGIVQDFVLSYLCQSCKKVPETFLVRRVGAKLTICGRAPIEHVDVPKYIPAVAKKYISQAIVTHQAGFTLAGLFLLRTFIEQWIRSFGARHQKADQALDWYMSTLPEDFKSWVPSLRDTYGQLSEAIHAGNASTLLFDKAMSDIQKHFDARRLRELPDPKAP